MNKRLIWAEGDDFTGWCCSHFVHHFLASRKHRGRARVEETFEKHTCAAGIHQDR